MRKHILITLVCLASLPLFCGCLGSFAANQGRRQAARSADYYVRTYAEPELQQMQNEETTRQMRDDIADTIVRTGNDRYSGPVGVNDKGYIVNK